MRLYVIIGSMLLIAIGMGCILSGPKEMKVTKNVLEEDFDVMEEDGTPILKVTIKVQIRNDGDPGNVLVTAIVWDEIDDEFARKTDNVHLDSGQSLDITFELEGPVTPEADIEAYYNVISLTTQVD